MKNRIKHPSSLLAIPLLAVLFWLVYSTDTTLTEAGKFLAEIVAGASAIFALYHKSKSDKS